MARRLPRPEDLASDLVCSIVAPPSGRPPANVLILLHGIGDTCAPFEAFATRLALPETACVSLQGHTPLPFGLGGFHWGDDIAFDNGSGQMDLDTGFGKSNRLILARLIKEILIARCGFTMREIMLFGFGQGGIAAVSAASRLDANNDGQLGGVLAIGGFMPLSSIGPNPDKHSTPVLVCKAARRSAVSSNDIARTREAFRDVELVEWNTNGDAMPVNREQMLPIMQFFARRLRSTAGVPAGAVEVK